jgi:farnesyl diphosphate synthase
MLDASFQTFLSTCQQQIEQSLENLLPAADRSPTRLHEAMRYATLGGGKRIRPTLTFASAQALHLDLARVQAAACAVECIHAYSLIHDDLPAMDDDDLRRGRPTCHKAFDEATAILAGDALQTLAFQAIATDKSNSERSRIQMIEQLARASGSRGMVGGQALDLAYEGQSLDLPMLETIHIHKTGALIRASVNMAALAQSTTSSEQATSLDRYAKCIGLAFQIQDDVLDVEGETATIGKMSGQDAAHHKATYPALMGLDAAHEAAHNLVQDALTSLQIFDEQADPLRWIAEYIIQRRS